jgi:phosphatidate cytidylyltransferase
LLLVVYYAPVALFFLFALTMSVLVAREVIRLHDARGQRPLVPAVFAGIALRHVAFLDLVHLPVEAAIALATALAFGACMVASRQDDDAVAVIGSTLSCIVYPGLLLAFQVGLRGLTAPVPGRGESLHAPSVLLFLYAVVFGTDAAAYFVGRALGRIPLAPRVSPNKTVEGLIGGVVGGVVLGVVVARLLPSGLGLRHAAGLAALVALAAVFGDLSKSVLKRAAGVKDSGTLLPGHGGALDRFDGLLFAAPLLYLLLTASRTGGTALPLPGAGG